MKREISITGNAWDDTGCEHDKTIIQHLQKLKMAEEIDKTMRELQ